jgi:hypothetical protein
VLLSPLHMILKSCLGYKFLVKFCLPFFYTFPFLSLDSGRLSGLHMDD